MTSQVSMSSMTGRRESCMGKHTFDRDL